MALEKVEISSSQYVTLNGDLKGTAWNGEWEKDTPHGQGALTVSKDKKTLVITGRLI